MNRRTFLKISIAGAITPIALFQSFDFNPNEFLQELIKEKLNYLTIEENGLAQFCSKYLKTKSTIFHYKVYAANIGHKLGLPRSLLESISSHEKLEQLKHELSIQFLLSSDYFSNDADRTKVVNYVQYYDPLSPVCSHPFARY